MPGPWPGRKTRSVTPPILVTRRSKTLPKSRTPSAESAFVYDGDLNLTSVTDDPMDCIAVPSRSPLIHRAPCELRAVCRSRFLRVLRAAPLQHSDYLRSRRGLDLVSRPTSVNGKCSAANGINHADTDFRRSEARQRMNQIFGGRRQPRTAFGAEFRIVAYHAT